MNSADATLTGTGTDLRFRRTIFMDLRRGNPPIPDCVQHEGWTAHEIASGEDAGNTGHLMTIHHHAAPIVKCQAAKIIAPRTRHGVESQGNNHPIGIQLGLRSRLEQIWSPARMREAHFRADES